jgi:hypothetical protein
MVIARLTNALPKQNTFAPGGGQDAARAVLADD